jgi:hypothetical protein
MKKLILATISDLCSNFLYYDRKDDEDLTRQGGGVEKFNR